MSHVALIPARKGSVRLPNKNFLRFARAGDSLTDVAVRAADDLNVFDGIILSTDSESYIDEVLHHEILSKIVTPILRPPELATSEATTQSVVKHALETYSDIEKPDYLTLMQPTSPFRREETWQKCFDLLLEHPEFDMVCTLQDVPAPFKEDKAVWTNSRRTAVFGLSILTAWAYHLTGGFYILRLERLGADALFGVNANIGGIVVDDPLELIDIDTEEEFKMAQAIIKGSTSLDYLGL